MIRRWWGWAALAALSTLLGAALDRLALPAALLLGPLLAAIAFGIGGATMRVPRLGLVVAQALIGCLVARSITASIVRTVADGWPAMLLVVSTTIVAAAAVGWVVARHGSLPGSTAAWGTSPGAASAMVAMAADYGADPRLVAFMQYLRVVVVVLSASLVARLLLVPTAAVVSAQPLLPPLLPFLATLAIAGGGGWIGRRLAIPAGAMLVPAVLGSVLHATGAVEITLPPWLLGAAYALLGWYVGLGFDREVVVYALRALPQVLAAIAALIGLCALSAWLLTALLGIDPLTAYLATSPGGLDSVAIIALHSNADAPFVLATQTLRLFLVILTGPPLARWIARHALKAPGT